MSRSDGESVEDWYTRTITEFRASQAELTDHTIRLGLDHPVRPGHLHRVLDDLFEAALDQFDDAALEMFQAAKAVSASRKAGPFA